MAPALAHHDERKLANGGRKQQVMGQDPKPGTYIQRSEKRGEASGQVEIGEGIVG